MEGLECWEELRFRGSDKGESGEGGEEEGGRISGRESEDSRTKRAREIAPSSAPMFVERAPRGAPSSKHGLRPLEVKTTPTPAPPEGLGRGVADPSVKIKERPASIKLWTFCFA